MLTPCAKTLWMQISNQLCVIDKIYDEIRFAVRPELKRDTTNFVKTSVRRNLKI